MMSDKAPRRIMLLDYPIEELNLSRRTLNLLKRSGINTIGQLSNDLENIDLKRIKGFGIKSLAEITEKLSRIKIVPPNQTPTDKHFYEKGPNDESVDLPFTIPFFSKDEIEHVVSLLSDSIEKQISYGLLHNQAKVFRQSIENWLSENKKFNIIRAHEALLAILSTSVNVCDEIDFLLEWIPNKNYLTVLVSRYGLRDNTLEVVGNELGITRERVRQIASKLREQIRNRIKSVLRPISASGLGNRPALLRIQSALYIAKDMGLDITYSGWERRLQTSGLAGDYTHRNKFDNPIEVMIAICRLLAKDKIPELKIPKNLEYAIQLAVSGNPDIPAKTQHIKKNLSHETKKLITRHTRFCGGAHARWLSDEMGLDLHQVKDILHALGYTQIDKHWFASGVHKKNYSLHKNHVLHHALRKMFQYCGPLSVEDICQGIRHAVSRTTFPAPTPDAMKRILEIYGYSFEDDLYYWDGEIEEELSKGEQIIMECLSHNGPVVHHTELAQAFIESELSFPSLHATLKRSPLFSKIETGLYKLRGRKVSRLDIERAEGAGERTPTNLEVSYDRSGQVIITVSLGILAIGTGTIFSEQFPNLSGEWEWFVDKKHFGRMVVTENEFRRLLDPFMYIKCQVGDRIQLTFNTWTRRVTLEKVIENDDKN